MSATRTFTPYVGGGAGGAVQAGDPWKPTQGEAYRQNIDVLGYLIGHFDLGGDGVTGITSASYTPVNSYRSFTLNGDSLAGLTLEAVVYYKTANAGTSVTVRVRNTTDSSTAATGATSTSTSIVEETLTLTLASGAKAYRLELTGNNSSNAIFGWGYLRLRKVPA